VPGRHREHWRYVAVWKLPSKELLDEMLPQVDQLPKWFEVMHELRVWGRIRTPEEGAQILLGARPTIMERLQPLEEIEKSAKAIASIVSEKPTITERLQTQTEGLQTLTVRLQNLEEQMKAQGQSLEEQMKRVIELLEKPQGPQSQQARPTN
jgi:hypothetical protein